MKTPQEIIDGKRAKGLGVNAETRGSGPISPPVQMATNTPEVTASVSVAMETVPPGSRPLQRPKKKGKPFHGISPQARDNKMAVKGRLPDGARFDVRYDASNMLWHGFISIPLADGDHWVCSAERSGVFALLTHLDDEYRQFKVLQENLK